VLSASIARSPKRHPAIIPQEKNFTTVPDALGDQHAVIPNGGYGPVHDDAVTGLNPEMVVTEIAARSEEDRHWAVFRPDDHVDSHETATRSGEFRDPHDLAADGGLMAFAIDFPGLATIAICRQQGQSREAKGRYQCDDEKCALHIKFLSGRSRLQCPHSTVGQGGGGKGLMQVFKS
jgi:hypothetical protein